MTDFARLGQAATEDIARVVAGVDERSVEISIEAIVAARRLALYGVGREGLMMRALAMRLYHLGLDAHVVGDMSTPPLGAGDLLIVSAGPGLFSTVAALVEVAKAAGARTLCFTAQPEGPVPRSCHHVLTLPAQTMADDQGAAPSLLPMGSLYEGAQYLVFEVLVLLLRDRLGETAESLRARHTNLE